MLLIMSMLDWKLGSRAPLVRLGLVTSHVLAITLLYMLGRRDRLFIRELGGWKAVSILSRGYWKGMWIGRQLTRTWLWLVWLGLAWVWVGRDLTRV